MNDLQVLEQKSGKITVQADSFVITTQESYDRTADFLLAVKGLKKEIDLAFDESIKKAHDTHKSLVAKKKEFYSPLENAERIVKRKIRYYEDDMEQKRLDLEAKAREEARKKEAKEKERLEAKAEKAVFAGDAEKAEELIDKAEDVEVLPETVAPTIERKKSLGIRRDWSWRVVDMDKVPKIYWMLNRPKIGQIVRTMKGDTRISGIEVFQE